MILGFRTILSTILLFPCFLAASGSEYYGEPPERVLQMLQDGNTRFVAGEGLGWRGAAAERAILAQGQHPTACVITCSDSRVSPEIIFDQSLGSLFVCRVAGNVVSPEIAGSVEYAVEHLKASVVVVLGHTGCGAVQAAVNSSVSSGPVSRIVERIAPAVDVCRLRGVSNADLWNETVSSNSSMGCTALYESCPAVQRAVMEGECMLVSATYDIVTGTIRWETRLTSVNAPGQVPSREVISRTEYWQDTHPAADDEGHSDIAEPAQDEIDQKSANRTTTKKRETRATTRPRRY